MGVRQLQNALAARQHSKYYTMGAWRDRVDACENIAMHKDEKLQELAQLLLGLFETATRLPNGPERQIEFQNIDDLRRRLASYIPSQQVVM